MRPAAASKKYATVQDSVQANSESVQCRMFQTWQWCLRMRSKCIDSTSGRKSVTGNGFSDINFLYNVESFIVRRRLSPNYGNFSLHAHAQFRPYYYFRFKTWRHIWVQRTRFPINMCGHFRRATPFSATFVMIICACTLRTLILLPVANLPHEMDSASPISLKKRTFRL